ncbi:MAG: serine hydrolase [Saprospiraceae bacterium]
MKNFILIIGLFWLISPLQSQSIEAVSSAYRQASSQVALLSNKEQFIPIKNLDHLRPLLISDHVDHTLTELLSNYITCPMATSRVLENRTWVTGTNLFIIEIDIDHTTSNQLFRLSATAHNLNQPYVVIFIHGRPASIPLGLFDEAKAIVFSWGYSDYISTHIAQVLFGAEGSTGHLPFYVNAKYRSGNGIETSSLNRLKYGPPEIVGIQSNLFEFALKTGIEDAIKNKVFPGANLLVAKDGTVIFHEAFGKPTYESDEPLHKDDLYDLASITKIFGATLGSMYLNSKGEFNPDRTLSTYLPSFKKTNKADLLWKDILTHRAGLPASIVYYRKLLDAKGQYLKRTIKPISRRRFPIEVNDHLFANKKIPSRLIEEIKRIPLLAKQDYVYSDLSMILLYKTIEQISHQPFDQFLNQHLYGPIGADHTLFFPLNSFTKDKIVPTEQDTFFRHTLVQGFVHDENAALLGGISGHAGLFSNANDMAKLAQMILNKGTYGGIQYLSPETIALYTSYQYPELENRRGLGFDKPLLKYDLNASAVARDASPLSFGHSGFTGTFIWIDPKYNLTYILLTNRVNPTRANNKISQYSIRPCIQQIIYDHILIKE